MKKVNVMASVLLGLALLCQTKQAAAWESCEYVRDYKLPAQRAELERASKNGDCYGYCDRLGKKIKEQEKFVAETCPQGQGQKAQAAPSQIEESGKVAKLVEIQGSASGVVAAKQGSSTAAQ